jgi:alkylation response protein AidB-like acyl-CoA dehydrogenase
MDYVTKRVQFGRPISSFQGMQFDIARVRLGAQNPEQ